MPITKTTLGKILISINHNSGSVIEAAKELGIARSTIYARLQKQGLVIYETAKRLYVLVPRKSQY